MKTVLVTGGSRGIGAAAVTAFAKAGCRVALNYHQSEARARELEQQYPGQVLAVQADVAEAAQVRAMFDAVREEWGPVDILVCNAGISLNGLFTDVTAAEWERLLAVNLSGAFHCCQEALPDMIRRKWGRIILVSSMWGQTGGSCEAAYSATKAGLIGLGKALAKEEGPSGITVNIVAPGVVDTDMMAGYSDAEKQALANEAPVGRLGTPEEIARCIVFLAGEQAGYITGQVLAPNGGLVI